ncbi:SHOCT domain-containing protein [Actinoplanes sp. NPDC004185]
MTLTALGYVITAAALLGQVGRTRDGARELLGEAGFESSGMLVFLQSAVVLSAVLTVIAALILLGAAARVRAGSRKGRIVAWGTMGTLLLCGLSAASRAGSPEFSGNVQITMSRADGSGTVTQSLSWLYADQFRIGSAIFAILALIAMGTAAVLLTRPSANRWFTPASPAGGSPDGYRPGPYAGPPAQRSDPPASGPPAVSGDSGNGPLDVSPPQLSPEALAELATLVRRHQRGELTDAEFAAAKARLA